ncbi:MAG: rod shape-determining protein MreC [Cyclobacteriaceae bacterium]|jgi:rod shape-determining protein MreC
MRRLFLLIYQYRAFFTFIVLEIIAFWLVIGTSTFHNAAFFNTSNNIVASIFGLRQGVYQYFNLVDENDNLAKENAFLRDLISQKRIAVLSADSSLLTSTDTTIQYNYIPAKVINNSTQKINNYLTIDKGSRDGLEPGMGAISSFGVVGIVKTVSNNYATLYSLLHGDMQVSSMLSRLGVFGTTKWDGLDPLYANLLYIPRHVELQVGDSIITSGYNAIFPEGIPIGQIKEFSIDENETFYNIVVELSSDFQSLSHVYLIQNYFRQEKDSVELLNE